MNIIQTPDDPDPAAGFSIPVTDIRVSSRISLGTGSSRFKHQTRSRLMQVE